MIDMRAIGQALGLHAPPLPAQQSGGGYMPSYPTSNPFAWIANQGMGTMNNLGNMVGQQFGAANWMNSQNRQAAYMPEAMTNIARMNNDAQVYQTNARLAAQLASMGMLGKILGGFGGMFGGGGGGYAGGMTGFKATDSSQQAGFAPQQGFNQRGVYANAAPPRNMGGSPTRMAMWQQRYGR